MNKQEIIILSKVNQIVAEGVIASEKHKRVMKWYLAISNKFDNTTMRNYKDEFANSLISRNYTKKVEDLAVFENVKLPKIPQIVDYAIAEELYSRKRLGLEKLTALKRCYNF